MSDELSRRLEQAASAHGRAAANEVDVSVLAASVVGKARRRRRVTGLATVAGAFVVIAAFAGGSFAVVDSMRSDVNPGTHRDGATVDMSQAPTAPESAIPSPPPNAIIAEYPPVAASRGEGFPEAYEMRDWVWDYVSEGWTVQSYSASEDLSVDKPAMVPDAVIYLVDPDGVAFELFELAPEHSVGARVVSWQENERTAHLVWAGDSTGVAPGGAVVDLENGAVKPLVFATPWGESSTVAPLAVSAAGNELWEAWLGTHQRFYRFAEADGWAVASINDLEGLSDRTADGRWDTAMLVDDSRLATRPDSGAVLLEYRPSRNGPLEDAKVYRVDTDTLVEVNVGFSFPIGPEVVCTTAEWLADAALTYDCGDQQATFPYPAFPETVAGASYGEAIVADSEWAVLNTSRVGFREATSVSYLVSPQLANK